MSQKARALQDRLNAATAQAKQYNKNESLTNNDETSYEHIKEMCNQFLPYYELWTTI